jgi:ZIP family zinc transporter/zinc and cadmium transporter
MLAVTVLGVMPEVLEESPDAAVYVLVGYLAVHLAQHVFTPHFHFGEETHKVSPSVGNSALLGLMLHTFFDGVAIASGFLVSGRLGVLLFLAVLLHKLPEGVTIASVMVAGGRGRASAVGAAAILGGATILGVLLTEQIQPLALHGLALSAGVTLYVAASNLVPEFQAKRGWLSALAFLGGAMGFFLTELLLEGWLR